MFFVKQRRTTSNCPLSPQALDITHEDLGQPCVGHFPDHSVMGQRHVLRAPAQEDGHRGDQVAGGVGARHALTRQRLSILIHDGTIEEDVIHAGLPSSRQRAALPPPSVFVLAQDVLGLRRLPQVVMWGGFPFDAAMAVEQLRSSGAGSTRDCETATFILRLGCHLPQRAMHHPQPRRGLVPPGLVGDAPQQVRTHPAAARAGSGQRCRGSNGHFASQDANAPQQNCRSQLCHRLHHSFSWDPLLMTCRFTLISRLTDVA